MRQLRRTLTSKFTVIGALGMAAATPGQTQHVHGLIELGVVVEGNTLSVSLHSPLDDLVGFEHAAENEQQAERLREAADLLEDADRMFGVPEGAGCDIQDVTIEAPDYLLPDPDDDGHHAEHAHEDSHDGESEGHSDSHGGDSEDHSDGHSHSEVDAQYIWECSAPTNISALEARFVNGFENVETIKIQIITSTGVRVLEGDSRLDRIEIAEP